MHRTSIRELDVQRDADGVVALWREAWPTIVTSRESWIHRMETTPERAQQRRWVAEIDGVVAASGFAARNFFSSESTTGLCGVMVAGRYRGRGIGAELYECALAHAQSIGATALTTNFYESDAGVAFATARGFQKARAEAESILDPRTVTEKPRAVDLRPVADVDPHLVYVADVESTKDMPATEPVDHMPYEEWVGHVLENPLFTPEGSFVAMVDGIAAAVSLIVVDPDTGRAAHMFTGTLRDYRGQGLARAVKLASIEWSAANGVTQLVTSNDETNAPMLAINRRLGYEPGGRRVEYVRAGTASSRAPRAPAT